MINLQLIQQIYKQPKVKWCIHPANHTTYLWLSGLFYRGTTEALGQKLLLVQPHG